MPKLNQIVAIEKSVKSRVYGDITDLHKSSQKAELFNGFSKNYRKKDEDGEDYPPETKKVQVESSELLAQISQSEFEKSVAAASVPPNFGQQTANAISPWCELATIRRQGRRRYRLLKLTLSS